MEQMDMVGPCMGEIGYQMGLSDFIPDEDLSESLKGDQIRITITNSKVFSLGTVQHKNLTNVIHNTNSHIFHKLKDLPSNCALSPRILKESFKGLYELFGICIEPKVFLTKIALYGGKSFDVEGTEKPRASYTLQTDLGQFVIQVTSVLPFNTLLIFNPTRIAKNVYMLKKGEYPKGDEINTLPTEAFRYYDEVFRILLIEKNLTNFIIMPFFKFLIPFPELWIFKFRYYLAYMEINVDVASSGNRMDVIESLKSTISLFSRYVVVKCDYDKEWIMVTGNNRLEGELQFKVYPKENQHIRIELTYGKEYMNKKNIKRRLPYNDEEMKNPNVFSILMKHANEFIEVISKDIKNEPKEELPKELPNDYVAVIRNLFSSPTKFRVITFLLHANSEPLKREDICQATGLEGHQVSNVLRQVPFLIQRLPNSNKFEVIPKAKKILQQLVEFFQKEALAIYETARKIENEIMELGIGLWKYGRGIFSNKPCCETYKALKEWKASIEDANQKIAHEPEFSEVRLRTKDYK